MRSVDFASLISHDNFVGGVSTSGADVFLRTLLRRKVYGFLARANTSSLIQNDECRSRYINVGLYCLRQLFFAKFDLKVHVDKGWMHVS